MSKIKVGDYVRANGFRGSSRVYRISEGDCAQVQLISGRATLVSLQDLTPLGACPFCDIGETPSERGLPLSEEGHCIIGEATLVIAPGIVTSEPSLRVSARADYDDLEEEFLINYCPICGRNLKEKTDE